MYEPWFVWAVIGIACIGMEMLMPGFVIFFFGLGALVTALFSLIPGVDSLIWLQILIFVIFSIVSIVFLRRHFARIFAGSVFDSSRTSIDDSDTGETAEVTEAIGSSGSGRIRFRGTTWNATSDGNEIPAGKRVRIVSRNGMIYVVEPVVDAPVTEKE
jgi:membrane protein implicated in regulation of membrane protease activity